MDGNANKKIDDALGATVIGTGLATLAFGTALCYVMSKRKNAKNDDLVENKIIEVPGLDKTKYPGGHIRIYYGTQTGTAENFSDELKRDAESNGFYATLVDCEDMENDDNDSSEEDTGPEFSLTDARYADEKGRVRNVFVMATYGEGEPTDNATAFVNYLREVTGLPLHEDKSESGSSEAGEEKKEEGNPSPAPTLSNIDYAVFGLGDREYEHYCAMGKFINRAMGAAGAKPIVGLGMGDDHEDIEADFEKWKDEVFWPEMKKRYIPVVEGGKKKVKKEKKLKMPVCNYAIEYLEDAAEPDKVPIERVHATSRHNFTADTCPITTLRELRSSEDPGSTLHIEVDTSHTSTKYHTADNLGVLPLNNTETVEALAETLGYDLDATFRLNPADGKEASYAIHFPNPCTVRAYLEKYADLTGSPRRSELKLLASYASDDATSRAALLRMASKEGKWEYKDKIVDLKIGIADIVTRLCPGLVIPLEHFVQLCPRQMPRYYTISSSSSVHPDSVHMTVSILGGEKRADGTVWKGGVCTNYLKDVGMGGSVRAFVRPSTFRLPADSSKPIIMIGPGTGVAPMRGLLQERQHQKETLSQTVGPNILYFGCKKRSLDYIYSSELSQYQSSGLLTDLHLAFSREDPDGKKVYVQHLLQQQGKATWELLDRDGAYVYVCGGVKMGNDVTETLRSIVVEFGGRSADDAKGYLDGMAKDGRFVQELWA